MSTITPALNISRSTLQDAALKEPLKVFVCQINALLGDISVNCKAILQALTQAKQSGSHVFMVPELALIGYPPEDLLFRSGLSDRIDKAIEKIQAQSTDILVVIGYPEWQKEGCYNSALLCYQGKVMANYRKQCLPSYQVFDDKRYFVAGEEPCVVEYRGYRLGVTICEDMWEPLPMQQLAELQVDIVLNINGSPYHMRKAEQRKKLLTRKAREAECGILYVNRIGGQDELVFDGRSMAVSKEGNIDWQGPHCQEALTVVEWLPDQQAWHSSEQCRLPSCVEAEVYEALVLGVRDYVLKNGFKGAVLGLSGGIDSALTLCIAVDALGKDQVKAIMMPYRYTSSLSMSLAQEQAINLDLDYEIKPINTALNGVADLLPACMLEDSQGRATVTLQNLQARLRGVLLMAVSNASGRIVLTTGNKSELAVGYSTLYGDMAGGYDVLKDVPKTLVYRLAAYRNEIKADIPTTVITRPPTAELAPNQKDEDSLPVYEILDQILELYIDGEKSIPEITAKGFDQEVVLKVATMVDRNEYKRRQSPLGVRITGKSFGRDRRYPVTFSWPS